MRRVEAVLVEEVRPFYYRGSAGAFNEIARRKPQWEDARTFGKDYIMPASQVQTGQIKPVGVLDSR